MIKCINIIPINENKYDIHVNCIIYNLMFSISSDLIHKKITKYEIVDILKINLILFFK